MTAARSTIQRPYLPGWLVQYLETQIPVGDGTADGRALYAAMIVGLAVAGYDLSSLVAPIEELSEQALPAPIKQAIKAVSSTLGTLPPVPPVLEPGTPLSPEVAKLLNELVSTLAPGAPQAAIAARVSAIQSPARPRRAPQGTRPNTRPKTDDSGVMAVPRGHDTEPASPEPAPLVSQVLPVDVAPEPTVLPEEAPGGAEGDEDDLDLGGGFKV